MPRQRRWTIYLCQDKHLDYNWCGSTTEIELRMVALLDYYLEQAERFGGCWNLDSTLWFEVYARHRGRRGADRLLDAIRAGHMGYGANHSVQLWGMMSTETAVHACLGSVPIEAATERPATTALIMENWGLLWGAATVLSECGITRLARGTYTLRAEAYFGERAPWPLFQWEAPNGKRLLVHWPPYKDTKSQGGYAEAFELAALAGERWDAFNLQRFGDRNSPEVFDTRRAWIQRVVKRYESLGPQYPVSSIMLLGTGWDNWTMTDDYRCFVERFNQVSDGHIRIVDARYDQFFDAVERELQEENLQLPVVRGSFGITWEEWPAHLADLASTFRDADRLVHLGETRVALGGVASHPRRDPETMLECAHDGLMRFVEHDMGGARRHLASLSAGTRAAAATQALDIGRSLAPTPVDNAAATDGGPWCTDVTEFTWRGHTVSIAAGRLAIASITNADGSPLVPGGRDSTAPLLGEVLVTRFDSKAQNEAVFPPVEACAQESIPDLVACRQHNTGTDVRLEGTRAGMRMAAHWRFHDRDPWIDLRCSLAGGWDEQARTVQLCFPVAISSPAYRYDTAGAILHAGPQRAGGDDLPGANPELFAAQTFAAATGNSGHMLVLTPDAYLVQFGPRAIRTHGYDADAVPALITSMPMMNLTRQDHQVGQGGQNSWTFRYRIVLDDGPWHPVAALRQAQQFATPPFAWVPGLPPAVSELENLDIDFPGGPLLTAKRPVGHRGLVLRFWNVLDHVVDGSIRMPEEYTEATCCDALERPGERLTVASGRVVFRAPARALVTLALTARKSTEADMWTAAPPDTP